MLSRFLRYLATLTILLTTSVAGLPLILCVSEADGAALELAVKHVSNEAHQSDHIVLFSAHEHSAKSSPCVDYQLQAATLGQSRADEDVSVGGGKTSVAFVATANDEHAEFPQIANVQPLRSAPNLRSTLADRSTIVLQI